MVGLFVQASAFAVLSQTFDLVSRSTDNKNFGTFYDSSAPDIGGIGEDDGRYIAFVSSAAGLGGSKGKNRQIFWRDRKTGETVLVSTGMNGADGNGDSFAPSISADGKSVAYESYATNLVPIDTNKVRDIFVWNYDTRVTEAVSTGPGEIETNSEAFDPTISGDGRFIAYSSSASNITSGVEGTSTVNVYLKDMNSHTTKLLSMDPKTKKGAGGSNPSISDDGSKVAFYSVSAKLAAGDNNELWDIFLYDQGNPKLKRISMTQNGGERDQGQESASRVVAPSISGNGKFVAYSTTATNVVREDTNKSQDVFVVDTGSGATVRASITVSGAQGTGDSPAGQGEKIAISFDGMLIAFSTGASNFGGNLAIRDLSKGETRIVAANTKVGVGRPAISRSGGYVVFGAGDRLDSRFQSTGIFAAFTGGGACRFCPVKAL